MIEFMKLNEKAIAPTKANNEAAGYNLYACIVLDKAHKRNKPMVRIPPHGSVVVGTGIAIRPPKGYFAAIFVRTGLSVKEGIRPTDCVTIFNEDYTGEYKIPIHNDSERVRYINHKQRIAQVIFLPYYSDKLQEVESFDETEVSYE